MLRFATNLILNEFKIGYSIFINEVKNNVIIDFWRQMSRINSRIVLSYCCCFDLCFCRELRTIWKEYVVLFINCCAVLDIHKLIFDGDVGKFIFYVQELILDIWAKSRLIPLDRTIYISSRSDARSWIHSKTDI